MAPETVRAQALADTKKALRSWGFTKQALSLAFTALFILYLLEGWKAVIEEWSKTLAAIVIPFIALATWHLIVSLVRAPVRLERRKSRGLERELLEARNQNVLLLQQIEAFRATSAQLRLSLVTEDLYVRWRPSERQGFYLYRQRPVAPEATSALIKHNYLRVGLLNVGEGRARDITIEWNFKCYDFTEVVLRSKLFEKFSPKCDFERKIISVSFDYVNKQGDRRHKGLQEIRYSFEEALEHMVVPPVSDAESTHQAVVYAPEKIMNAMILYALCQAHWANGQPANSTGRMPIGDQTYIRTQSGDISEPPPESETEREWKERSRRLHKLPLLYVRARERTSRPFPATTEMNILTFMRVQWESRNPTVSGFFDPEFVSAILYYSKDQDSP